MAKDEEKNNNKLIIAIVAGIVVVVGVVVLLIVLIGGGNYPSTVAELQKAITNKEAINCKITNDSEEGEMNIQANDGWTKFKMSGNTEGTEVNTLMIEGDAGYMWTDGMAIKNKYNSTAMDEFTEEMGGESEDEEGIVVKCSNPSGNDFSVPDKDWMDLSAFGDDED